MKRKVIELKEFEYSQCELGRLYDNQDRPFVIETDYGEIAMVCLKWQQGHSPNYYFEGLAGIFYPENTTFIEFIPEWGMC